MKIGLIPLDERPVNTRYPRMIGAIAGIDVLQPPRAMLSRFRQPANCAALSEWLREGAADLDALVVSIEMLVHGGLVPSRISDDSTAALLGRLELLREIKAANPALRIYGFNLITRISKNPDSVEEPSYWRESGPQIYRYSQAWDAHRWGDGPPPHHEHLERDHLLDVLRRRQRNHIVNLAVLDLLADDVFDLLVVSSDDTSETGFGTREKAWVKEWVDRRGGDERLLMYPGADEVGSALLARALVDARGARPRCYVHYAIEADKHRIAPFEDGPVCLTVERQLRAVGGVEVESEADADLIVAVNPPAPSNCDFFDPAFAASDREYRFEAVEAFARQISDWIDDGKRVIVPDVAYPNGSDPVLIEALERHLSLRDLAGYGGWNTAGNTIGVALAGGIAALQGHDEGAALRFLAHRFVEDYGYMHLARPQMDARAVLYDDKTEAAMIAFVTEELNDFVRTLADFREWRVTNVRLPWKRRFEVDFDLERA